MKDYLREWIDTDRPLSTFDWLRSGVDKPYVILFSARSGSTLLTTLVTSAGGFGDPREWLISPTINNNYSPSDGRGSLQEYLSLVADRTQQGGYFGVELDGGRLPLFRVVMDFEGVFGSVPTQFIRLRREDLVAQAFSLAKALATGLWHEMVNGRSLRDTPRAGVVGALTDSDIWSCVFRVLRSDRNIDELVSRLRLTPLEITYEELVASRTQTLTRIFHHLGTGAEEVVMSAMSAEPRTKAMIYDDRDQVVSSFRARYLDLLKEVSDRRSVIEPRDIVSRLEREYGYKFNPAA